MLSPNVVQLETHQNEKISVDFLALASKHPERGCLPNVISVYSYYLFDGSGIQCKMHMPQLGILPVHDSLPFAAVLL